MDRTLYSPVHYPGDYGFIPGTLADDGDPADVLVLVEEPSFSGCMIEVRPIGIMDMIDQDQTDQKILAVPNRNPRYDEIHTMDQIFIHVRREKPEFKKPREYRRFKMLLKQVFKSQPMRKVETHDG